MVCWPGLNEKYSIYEDGSKCMNRFVVDNPPHSEKFTYLLMAVLMGEESTQAASPHTQVNERVPVFTLAFIIL